MNGKPCHKHKCFSVEGEDGKQCLVCEDCLHRADSAGRVQDYVKECGSCGRKLSEVVAGGKMGCPSCYESFSDTIAYVIASVQRGDSSMEHIGRVPRGFLMERAKSIGADEFFNNLTEEIERAVAAENYREAARLKGKLTELEVIRNKKRANSEELALFIFRFWTEE